METKEKKYEYPKTGVQPQKLDLKEKGTYVVEYKLSVRKSDGAQFKGIKIIKGYIDRFGGFQSNKIDAVIELPVDLTKTDLAMLLDKILVVQAQIQN